MATGAARGVGGEGPGAGPGGGSLAPWVARLRSVVEARLGYAVPGHRLRAEIASALEERARGQGFPSPSAWLEHAASPEGGTEWRALVSAVAVGETYFFRHAAQLEALAGVLGALHRRRGDEVRVWSAGCAGGEEPYSLAMLLADRGVPARILATDVRAAALDRAREASGYRDRSVGHVPEGVRRRWLRRDPEGTWSVLRAGRLGVRFLEHNLATDPAPAAGGDGRGFDAAVCRNVLVYFTPSAAAGAVARLLGSLGPDGGLWLDAVERARVAVPPGRWEEAAGEPVLRPEGSPPASVAPPAAGAVSSAPPEPWSPAHLERLVGAGLLESARSLVEARLAAHPDDADALLARAAFHVRAHEIPEALALCEAAGRRVPAPPGLDHVRGVALLKAGRPDQATRAFEAALEDGPQDWACAFHLANLHRQAGRALPEEVLLERALEGLARAGEEAPDLGAAAALVEGAHADPATARRLARERLGALLRASGRAPAARP